MQDGKVDRAPLIAIGHGHVSQFRARMEHPASLSEIIGTNSIRKAPNRDTVNIGFEFGPVRKAITAGENQLSIVQGEVSRIGVGVVGLNLRCGFRFVSKEGAKKFLRLAFQLINVWAGNERLV